ncbi:MAG: SUMF1/EgtB/PvdO family nonheme iron enzyme, partial [Planctomycetota bacterium]
MAALAAAARAEEASEEKLLAVEMAADEAERARALRAREELAKSDEDVAAICRVLDNTKIDLDFTDASLEDIIGFIREYARINIEIDQKVREEGLAEKKITFQQREGVLHEVLDQLVRLYDLDYTYDHKVLLILLPQPCDLRSLADYDCPSGFQLAPIEGVESAAADEEIRRRMRDTKISLSFTDATFSQVLLFLTVYARIPFVVEAGSVDAVAGKRVSFRVDELPFEQAFDLIMKMLDLGYFIQAGQVHIVSAEAILIEGAHVRGGTPTSSELEPLGKNDQGQEEFRHEGTGIVLVRIPAGEYKTEGEDGAVGWVTVPKPFLIGRTEVTNEQFQRFARGRRYLAGHSSGKVLEQDLDGAEQPAVGVTWREVQVYCEWAGLRLSTEQEWELVARGGDGRRFPWGNEWPPPAGGGNYADAGEDGGDGVGAVFGTRRDGFIATAPVGKGSPNPFGVYDLGGNVWEWCA